MSRYYADILSKARLWVPYDDPWELVTQFEKHIAEYTGAKYAVSTDSCTHAIEILLRLFQPAEVTCPKHTYLSIPFTLNKLGIDFKWTDEQWEKKYQLGTTDIWDCAVGFEPKMYVPGSFQCLSFQIKKSIPIGRGGMILLDDERIYKELTKLRYDGRMCSEPWHTETVNSVGYHYYMTPEAAAVGLLHLYEGFDLRTSTWMDYPDLEKKLEDIVW